MKWTSLLFPASNQPQLIKNYPLCKQSETKNNPPRQRDGLFSYKIFGDVASKIIFAFDEQFSVEGIIDKSDLDEHGGAIVTSST